MNGGFKAFWNVTAADGRENARRAEEHGFSRVTILNTFDDYPGHQKESIQKFVGSRNANPWDKPSFFERIVRQNIEIAGGEGIVVHDIEINYQWRPFISWNIGPARRMSRAQSFHEFKKAYWKEWATWATLPIDWTKQRFPQTPTGVFGFQPFLPDTLRILDYPDEKIAYYHEHEAEVWRHIEPHVDFAISSAYMESDDPIALYHAAFHYEANHALERALADKPLYAYLWLRKYRSDWTKAVDFLAPHTVEAMAILPYFSGAKGTVLWGYEPQVTSGQPLPYQQLATYVQTIARIARVSDLMATGRLVLDNDARELWRQKKPIVRRFELPDDQCIVMAVDPWQIDDAASQVEVPCAGSRLLIPVSGKHTTIAHIAQGRVMLH